MNESNQTGVTLEQELVRLLNGDTDARPMPWSRAIPPVEGSMTLPRPAVEVRGVRLDGNAWSLLLSKSESTHPSDLRAVARRLAADVQQRASQSPGERFTGVLLAESLARPVRRDLRGMGLGYYDAGGSLLLTCDKVYWEVDHPPPVFRSNRRGPRSLGTGSEAVLHAWLQAGIEWVTERQLAEEAKTSDATAGRFIESLRSDGGVEPQRRGRAQVHRLIDPAALLATWVNERRSRRDPVSRWRHPAYPVHRIHELASAIVEVLATQAIEWTLTGNAGADLLTPHLTGIARLCFSIPRGTAQHVARATGLRQADDGDDTVWMIERSGAADFLFKERLESNPKMWVGSPHVVYADLLTMRRGRDPEMAAHLRRFLIGY